MLNQIGVNFSEIPVIDPVTGFFGPETAIAVSAFQGLLGMDADITGGIVDRMTWHRIAFAFSKAVHQSEERITTESNEENYPYIHPGCGCVDDSPTLHSSAVSHTAAIPTSQLLTMFLLSQVMQRV